MEIEQPLIIQNPAMEIENNHLVLDNEIYELVS